MTSRSARPADLSAHIADRIRAEIASGALVVDERLPSEAELAARFSVSRPTVREALKRLAAQSLIRTRRGASGGAFVNRMTFEEAGDRQAETTRILVAMHGVDVAAACEARLAVERACLPLVCARRQQPDLAAMHAQTRRQADATLSAEDFRAADLAFHRSFVMAAGNPMLTVAAAGPLEAAQLAFAAVAPSAETRMFMGALNGWIADAVEARDADTAERCLVMLDDTLRTLPHPPRSP